MYLSCVLHRLRTCLGSPTAQGAARGRRARGAAASSLVRGGVGLAVVLLALSGHARLALSQEAGVTEYRVKAAFLYNFAKFIAWPADSFGGQAAAFELCVLGGEAYEAARDTLAGKRVQGRALEIRRIASVAETERCHMLFVAREESVWAEPGLATVARQTLTVGETGAFTRHGGVVTLLRVDNRIRFEIAREAGERSGFRFSAQLLSLAILVDQGR